MIVTLRVKLGTSWSAEIEFDELTTLDEVHDAIQDAVEFDNDHLYGFFVARTRRASRRTNYDEDDGGVYDSTLRDLFPLPPKNYLFYLFDYGASWIFKISATRKKPHEPIDGILYPRVVKETGEKPVQYDFGDEE